MLIAAEIILFFVALIHGALMLIGLSYWDAAARLAGAPRSLRERAPIRSLLASLSLHNGFLAAGLCWGIFNSDPDMGLQIQFFFAGFIVILGGYNVYTAKSGELLGLQLLPALLAVVLILAA